MENMVDRILRLKQERNAAILAHYYEAGEIQDIADHVGDSLFLAEKGATLTNPVVLLAGVVFMAESVKLLSPEKIVLAPDLLAGCSLVDESPAEKYLQWRLQHPHAIAVTYVNSSARVKAISDVICTSSNAEKVIEAIPRDREILFGPDQNLGKFLVRKLSRPMTLWQGSCMVHVLFSQKRLHLLKLEHPDALVIAHPECDETVLNNSDFVGSTSALLNFVEKSQAREFIVATEDGILHQMKKKRPDALLIQAPTEPSCACNQCPFMKLNTLEKIANALQNLSPQVNVSEALRERAKIPLSRMLQIQRGERPDWPAQFDGVLPVSH